MRARATTKSCRHGAGRPKTNQVRRARMNKWKAQLLESGIAVGYVFLPGAQFVACSSPRSRFEPAVRTPGGPVARHPQPRGRKPVLRREIPWILRGFQGRLSC